MADSIYLPKISKNSINHRISIKFTTKMFLKLPTTNLIPKYQNSKWPIQYAYQKFLKIQ